MERLLRIATWTSAGALLAGLVLALAGAAQAPVLLHGGLWLLVATPIARVLMALWDYLQERDWLFVLITIVVLLSLMFPVVRFLATRPG
jgi:uncharacterized membrane protein